MSQTIGDYLHMPSPLKEAMMKALNPRHLLSLLVVIAAALFALPAAAMADDGSDDDRDRDRGSRGAVFVQTNEADGNRILAYRRAPNGTLREPLSYSTGGLGTGLTRTSSQGPVVLSEDGDRLFTVNQASNDISVFDVHGRRLTLLQRIASGGVRPFSITQHDEIVYVLNNGNVADGPEGVANINGYRLDDGRLEQLPDSTRELTQAGTDPAQVGFTPNGRSLVVTEKETNRLDTFDVGRRGYATDPRVHASAGMTPFGFDFTRDGTFVVTEAAGGEIGKATASSYRIGGPRGLRTLSGAVPDFRSEVCWTAITNNDRFAYITNFGDGTISSYRIADDGTITLHESIAAVTTLDQLSIRDAGFSEDGRYLYAIDIASQKVHAWEVDQRHGDLTPIGAFPGLPGTVAGLAAT